MQKQEKSRKPLIIGIIAAVVILAVLLVLLLTQCTGGQGGGSSTPATEDTTDAVPTYQLYWNADRAEYDGKSEAGMSSRMPEEDGYFHVRFILDGEELVLKVADRKLINAIDVQDVMGLEFDEDGIVIGVLNLDDMPLEKVGWQFYVQSAARTMIKLNSSESMNGMEVMLEDLDPNRIWDMSGKSGPIGVVDEAIELDKIMAIQNLAGEITHVFIFERPNYMLTHEDYCEHCKQTVTWSEWVKDTTMPTLSGHYQLQNDIQLSTQASLPEDAKICLDLNGHRIDGKQSGGRAIAMFNPAITLAIMDTSEEQTGVVAAHGKVDQGGVVWVRYGAFYLYSGTLDASDATTQKGGTAVECGNGKFFYMYGGTIIGGTSTYTYNAEKNSYGGGHAGAVSIGGKFVMNGGEIRDGHAEAAVVYKDGKISSYQRGYGGNLYLGSTAEFEMNGGTIKNGRAGGGGGNIFADGAATLTINGGTISGGYVYGKGRNGGSVYLGSKTTTDFNGGSIYGGVSYNCGGNVYLNGKFNMNGGYIGGGVCYNFDTRKVKPAESSANMFVVNGKLTMWGGTIAGHVSAVDSKKDDKNQPVISLYGVARIDGSTVNRNLTISGSADGVKVIVGNLYKGAKIGVNTTIGLFTEPTKEEYKQYFYSDIEGAEILYHQERLALGRLNCICGKSHNETVSETHINGCDGELLLWAPWTSTNSIPTTTGNYFLSSDITTKAQTVVNGGNDVKVDLNGKNITLQVQTNSRDGWRLYRADNGAKLAITDTTDKPGTLQTFMPAADADYTGGKFTVEKTVDGEKVKIEYTKEDPEGQKYVKALWEKANFGMLLWARGGEITLHNAILDGSNLTGAQNGMLVAVGNNVVTDEETGEQTTYVGKLDMYGGTIIGGYTRAKGNVNIGNGAVMNLYGGTITGGRADAGGNINVLGTLNMYGGTVTKGIVDRSHEEVDGGLGGNINVDYDKSILGTMNMYGGVVSDGYVKAGQNGGGHGGNIIVYGTLNVTGGVISGGETSSAGGNIATIGANSKITLENAKVLDGKAHTGGNIAVNVRSNKGLYLLKGTEISGGYASATSNGGGGNIAINLWVNTVDQDQVVVIDGATISDGTAAGNAGNLYVRNATTNRIVVDEKTGKEKQDRFEVAVDVTMKSGTISGGMNGVKADGTRARFNGGSVFMTSKSTFTLEDGTITGGDTSDVGGCFYTNGLLTVKGGTISGGTTKGKVAGSSNVTVVNGTLAMSGGVIDGNVTITATKAGAAKVLLSGKPVVKQNVAGIALSYYNNTQPLIEIDGELEEGSSVAVTGSGYISTETPETNLKYFSSKSDTIIHYNKCMFIGRAYCICGKSHDTTVSDTHINGCDGTVYAWERWTATSTIPTRSGNFYLGADVTTKTQTVVTAGKDIKLDLNGKNITLQVQPHSQDGFRLYRVEDDSKLAITDTTDKPGTLQTVMPGEDAVYPGKTLNTKASKYDEDGKLVEAVYFTEEEVKAAWARGNGGMLLWVRGGKVSIHNAILDGSNLEGANGGMLVLVGSNTITNKVIDPETNEETEEKTYYYGELNMYNGTIIGGYTKASGNISVSYGCTMNMFGGTITSGRAYAGGNIHVAGTLNIHDGLITKGLIDRGEEAVDAGSGGNINIDNSGVVNMLGGAVTDGTAIGGNGGTSGGHAGNIHVYGKLNATGGTISGGETRGGGGNIGTIGSNARIILDGVQVLDGEASRGGNICVNVRVCRELIITEKTVVSGGKATNGGNVAVSAVNGQGVGRAGEDAMIVRIEGVIKDGTASGSGGNIHISNAVQTDIGDKPAKKQDEIKVTISGTSVTDGKGGNGGGGNIYLYNANTEITDTEILNGTLTRKNAGHADGGNIYASKGTLKLVGCVVDKGTGKSAAATATQNHYARGGNMFVDSAELTIDSTVISNGSTHGTGANGRAYSGNMHLTNTDATICNGSQIIDGKTTREDAGWAPAGNLFIEGGSDVTITDTEISGGNGTSSCNNIYLNLATDTLTLGKGAVVRNTVSGSKVNICYRGGTLNVLEGALITNDEGIACRNIGYIAEANAEFNMSGGKIEGGDTSTFVNGKGEPNGGGANLHFTTHKNEGEIVFNMTGGEIVGGSTNTNGGNVYTANPGTFTMSGGSILDGSSKAIGGNMYFGGTGTITLSGGTISGGHAIGTSNNGGNISVGSATTVTLEGDVKVIDGTADNCAGNIYVNGVLEIKENTLVSGGTSKNHKNIFAVNGHVVMSGGTVDGGLQLTTTDAGVKSGDLAKLTLSGAPVITKNDSGVRFNTASAPIEIVGTLTEGAEIWTGNTGVVTSATVSDNAKFFTHIKSPVHNTYFIDDAMVQAGIAAEDKDKVYIGQYHCVCGATGSEHLGTCGGTKLLWSAWGTNNALPTKAGNYYLTTNVTAGTNEVATATSKYALTLDLNGFEVKSTGGRLYRMHTNQTGVDLTITDTAAEKGKIYSSERTYDQGSIIWAPSANHSVELYNVTIDGSKLTLDKSKTWLSGVVLSSSGDMGLYGTTTIIGGDSLRGQSAIELGSVAELRMDPSVAVNGEIFVNDSAKIVMDGLTDASKYTVNASGAFTVGNTITASDKFFKSNTEAEIFLEGSEQFAGHTYCICGKTKHLDSCGGAMLNWRPYRFDSNIPNAHGNWYLTQDVKRTSDTDVKFTTTGMVYNLNLNGKTVKFAPANGKGYRLFRVTDGQNIQIGITDLDQTGKPLTTGKVEATITSGGQDGSIFWITQATHKLDIYGGTFDATNVTMASDKDGTVLKINRGEANIYGGTLIGGTTKVAGATVSINGGAVLNMYGGTIKDGQTAAGDISGGNIFIKDNAVMNMYDGVVEGGKSPGGTTPSSNGAIWGGYGGNMLIVGTLNMSGGEIRDGGGRVGTNICLQARNADQEATLNMSGGIIAGGIAMDKRTTNGSVGMPKVILSGAPIISKDKTTNDASITKPTTSLAVASGVIIDAKGLTGGEIYVSGSGQFGVAVEGNADVALKAFHSETEDEIVLHNKTELHFGKNYCLCGASKYEGKAHQYWCDGMHSWIEWNLQNILEDGYYYVAKNNSSSPQRYIGVDTANTTNTDKNDDVVVKVDAVIDLNGNRIYGSRALRLRNGSLGITDTSKNGTGIVEGTFYKYTDNKYGDNSKLADHSGTILMGSNVVLNIYAGTITHTDEVTKDGKTFPAAVRQGGVIRVPNTAVVNMYGGTITGGTAVWGGNVEISYGGVFNLYGGTIKDGKALAGLTTISYNNVNRPAHAEGGNVWVAPGGTFNMKASDLDVNKVAVRKVSGGTATSTGIARDAHGANLYVLGTANILDGSLIEGGLAQVDNQGRTDDKNNYGRGGSIFVGDADGGVVTIEGKGTKVSGGTAKTTAYTGATTGWAPGGNIYVNGNGTLNADKGAEISGGVATTGQNLYLNSNDCEAYLNDVTVHNTMTGGHSITVQMGELTIDGATITTDSDATINVFTNDSGTSTSLPNGYAATVKIMSGSISGAKQNVLVNKGDTLELSGGTIDGGLKVVAAGTTVKVTGAPTVANKNGGMILPTGYKADFTGLTGGSIYVSGSGRFGTMAEGKEDLIKASVISANGDDEVYVHNVIELHFAKTYCLCGFTKTGSTLKDHASWCDKADRKWIEWNKGDITVSGNYYAPVSTNNTFSIGQLVIDTPDIDVALDLNGQKIQNTAANDKARVFSVRNGVHMSITDTAGGGQLVGSCTSNAGTLHVLTYTQTSNVTRDTVLNLYAGTVTRTGKGTTGGVIQVCGDSDGSHKAIVNMFDGTVIGGQGTNGGNVHIQNYGYFNLKSGTIEDGTADNGGNIFVQAKGEFNQTGGTVTGGTAVKGGNIYVENGGTVNISGEKAKVEYGLAKYTSKYAYGGNFYMDGGTVNLTEGATVAYGSVSSKDAGWAPGANFYVNKGTLNVTGATINNGQNVTGAQSNTDGNNLYINYGAEVNLNAGAVVENNADASENIVIQGGKLKLDGGKIYNASGVTKADGIVTNSSWKKDHPTDSTKWPVIEIISGEIYGGRNNMNIAGGTTVKQYGGSVYGPVARNVILNDSTSTTVDDVTYTGYSVYEMTGGKIYGGKNPNGGNVYMGTNAELTMSDDAQIYGGTASGNGGNLYVGENAELSMSGNSAIYGGTANEGCGGNIYLADLTGATATISGNAKVYDGTNTTTKATDKPNGGSIWVGKAATLTLKENAEVYGGDTCNCGGNIYNNGTVTVQGSAKIYNAKETINSANVFNVGGTLDIQGGTIAGGVEVYSGTIKLSGAPVINKALTTVSTVPPISLKLNNGIKMDLSGLTGGEIYVTGTVNTQIAEKANSATLLNYVHSEVTYGRLPVEIDWIETEKWLWLGRAEDIYCVCGASYEDNTYTCQCGEAGRVWVQWTEKYSLPTATGNYYLAGDVELTADTIPVPAEGAQIAIDLRGNSIKLENNEKLYDFVGNGGAKVIITDSTNDATKVGSVISTGTSTGDGGMFVLDGGNSFELYRATLDASGLAGDNGIQGGVAFISANATLTIHSGTVKGATCHEGGAFFLYKANAKLILEDGTITGGKAAIGAGGNVVVCGGEFTMNGGTVSDGQALKGAGNIVVSAEGQFTMNDGTISGGVSLAYLNNKNETVSDAGGNIRVYGDSVFTMNGGLIKGGVVTADGATSDSANVFVQNSAMVMTGGTIWGGVAIQNHKATADNIPSLTVSGAAVIDGRLNQDANGNQLVQKSVSLWGVTGDYAARIIEGADKLQTGACIGLNGTDILLPASVSEASLQYFFADSGDQEIGLITEQYVNESNGKFSSADIGKLYVGQIHCVCGGLVTGSNDFCDHSLHIWHPIAKTPTPTQKSNTSVYYYLTGSITESTDTYVTYANNNAEQLQNFHMYLDLNGFNMTETSDNSRVFSFRTRGVNGVTSGGSNNCSVTLTNTANALNAADKSTVTVSGKGDQGRLVWMANFGGSGNNTFRMFNLNAKFNGQDKDAVQTGGMICLTADGTAYLRNVSFSTDNTEALDYNGYFLSVANGSRANIINCSFAGAKVSHIESADGSKKTGNGGAIYSAGQITMVNSTVSGNNAADFGGGMFMEKSGKLTVSGNTVISGNTVGTAPSNVYVTSGAKVILASDFTGNIGLNGAEDVVIIDGKKTTDAVTATTTVADHVKADDTTNQQLVHLDDGIILTDSANIIQCACGGKVATGLGGHQHKLLVFTPWSDSTKLPTTTSGNYYLTTDVETTSYQNYGSAAVVNIDLHDHNVVIESSRAFRLRNGDGSNYAVTIGITNTGTTDGKGVISNTYATAEDGGMLWTTAKDHTFNLYAGTLDASGVTTKDTKDAPCIKITAGSVFNMYGGTIKGGTTTGSKNGGAVYINNSTFNMYAGTIEGGNSANFGGNVFVYGSSGLFNMVGGTVTGGEAATKGGNICGSTDATIKLGANAIVKDGYAGTHGGNIYTGSNVEINGATVQNGTAGTTSSTEAYGGNIYGSDVSDISIKANSLIKEGKAITYGGNIYSDGKLEINGATVQDGYVGNTSGNEGWGGNIYGGTNSDITVTSAQISGGFTVSSSKKVEDKNGWNRSASVRAAGVMAITDSTINGSVYFDNSAVVTIFGNTKIAEKQGISVNDSDIASITFKDLGADAKFKIFLTDNLKNNYSDTTGDAFAVIEGTATTSVFTVPASFTIVDGEVFLVK